MGRARHRAREQKRIFVPLVENSLGRRVLRAGLVVGAAHLLFKLAGLIQVLAMGRTLEPWEYDVVYGFAFENCVFAIFICFEEVVPTAFLPVFMRTMKDHGEERAQRFAGKFLTLQFTLLLGIFLLLMAYPEWVVRIWTKWRPDTAPEHFALGVRSVRGLAPALFGLSLGATTYMMLNGHKRFFFAAFGDAAWKFVAVAVLCAGVAVGSQGMARFLILGLVAGSVCKILAHLWGLRDKLRFVRPSVNWNDPLMRQAVWLALPLIAGIVLAKVRDNLNYVYVLSNLPDEGLIQANSIGRKLQLTFHFIVPMALAKAVFPFFCALVDQRDSRGIGEFVTRCGRMMLGLFYPMCGLVAVIAAPLVALMFKGEKFGDANVLWTSVSMACYMFVLPALALEAVLMQAFMANRRVFSMTALGVLFSAMSVGLSFLGLYWFRETPVMVLGFIAGGFALTRLLKTAVMAWMLRQNAPVFPVAETLGFLARVVACTVLAAACAWLALRGTDAALSFAPALPEKILQALRVCAGGGAGALATLGGFWVLRIREPFDMISWSILSIKRGKIARERE